MIEVNSIISHLSLKTDDIRFLQIINAFAIGCTIEEVLQQFNLSLADQIKRYITELIKMGALTLATESDRESYHNWHWSALAYHYQTRPPDLGDSEVDYFINDNDTIATRNRIFLLKGNEEKSRDFANVLESRQSRRNWPEKAISFEVFSKFLWLSAGNKFRKDDEKENRLFSRPYPSGGAVYSLCLYIVIGDYAVKGITAGVYKYFPDDHNLEILATATLQYGKILQLAGKAADAANVGIAIFITSKYAEQSKVYPDLAYSLILKEVGCIIQTFYLVTEYLDLSCCAIAGSLPCGMLAGLCNTNEDVEPLVGEFLIGPR